MSFISKLLNQPIRPSPRVYAITFKNKILAVYCGTLTLARLSMALATAFFKPPTFIDLPALPIDAFNMCLSVVDLRLMLIPSSLGTAFGASLR